MSSALWCVVNGFASAPPATDCRIGGFDLDVSAAVELAADRAQHRGARDDIAAGRGIRDQVEIATALLEVGILQTVPFLRQGTERLRQDREVVHL